LSEAGTARVKRLRCPVRERVEIQLDNSRLANARRRSGSAAREGRQQVIFCGTKRQRSDSRKTDSLPMIGPAAGELD